MGIRSCSGNYRSILQDSDQKIKTEIHHRRMPAGTRRDVGIAPYKVRCIPIVGVGVLDDPCRMHRSSCHSRANPHRTQRRGRRPRRPAVRRLPEPGAMWASRPTGCGASQSIRHNEKREANSPHVSVMLRFTVGRPPAGRRDQCSSHGGAQVPALRSLWVQKREG